MKMSQMSVAEFLSAASEMKDPLVVLVDLASSTETALRVASDCKSSWFTLATADIKSMAIIDFATCDDGQGYHKVSIILKEQKSSLEQIIATSRCGQSMHRQPFDFPGN